VKQRSHEQHLEWLRSRCGVPLCRPLLGASAPFTHRCRSADTHRRPTEQRSATSHECAWPIITIHIAHHRQAARAPGELRRPRGRKRRTRRGVLPPCTGRPLARSRRRRGREGIVRVPQAACDPRVLPLSHARAPGFFSWEGREPSSSQVA
jgi:hypothetical protein